MKKTAEYLSIQERTPIIKDEMKDGFWNFAAEIDASHIDDKVDMQAKNRVDVQKKDKEIL